MTSVRLIVEHDGKDYEISADSPVIREVGGRVVRGGDVEGCLIEVNEAMRRALNLPAITS